LTAAIAHRAARIRSHSRLRLPDAVQVVTALETSSIGVVTHDRDFSSLDVLSERVVVYG
jgi:predicted nucleic acid-binding protein